MDGYLDCLYRYTLDHLLLDVRITGSNTWALYGEPV